MKHLQEASNLEFDPQQVERVAQAVERQPLRTPPPDMFSRIMQSARSSKPGPWGLSLKIASGAGLVVLLWFLFIAIIQPGIALNWSSRVDGIDQFLVYRAEPGSSQYSLVATIPSRIGATEYTYLDLQITPGKKYRYQLEAVGGAGVLLHSLPIIPAVDSLLPVYAILLVISILACYAIMYLSGLVLTRYQFRMRSA